MSNPKTITLKMVDGSQIVLPNWDFHGGQYEIAMKHVGHFVVIEEKWERTTQHHILDVNEAIQSVRYK